jgi:CHAD domain-containing protein
MAFRLRRREKLNAALRRIAGERLDAALKGLSDRSDADGAVHEARKDMKRLRALLRLMRSSLGAQDYRRENVAYRDIARQLATARDAKVLLDTLSALESELDGEVSNEALADIRSALSAGRDQASREESVRAALVGLEAARLRLKTLRLKEDEWPALAGGLKRLYRCGRRGYALAAAGGDSQALHDWRKEVKYLWHGLQLLEAMWPKIMGKLADEAHLLADLLGDDHDLAALTDCLNAEAVGAQALSPLRDLIGKRRRALQAKAVRLGAKLYAEKPGAFVKRHQAYWQAWKRA